MKKWLVLLCIVSTTATAYDSRLSLNDLCEDRFLERPCSSKAWYGDDYDGMGAKIGRRTYFYVPLAGDYHGLVILRRF